MKRLLLLILFLSLKTTQAQITFQKTYGNSYNDYPTAVLQTSDGGFIIVGYTDSLASGYDKGLIIKTNSDGDILWSKKIGNLGIPSVQPTYDGGYIIIKSPYLIKLDANGNALWAKSFQFTDPQFANPTPIVGLNAVRQTSDSGFILAGDAYLWSTPAGSDAVLIKTDSSGNPEWLRYYGASWSADGINSVGQTLDGGFVACGSSGADLSGGYNQMLVFKTDSTGNFLWAAKYSGSPGHDCSANSVVPTSDGGCIALGFLYGFGDFLFKFNSQGVVQWRKNYADSTGTFFPNSIEQASDGQYLIAGMVVSAGHNDAYLVKADTGGNVLWSKTYGGISDELATCINKTADGGFVIGGVSNSSVAVGQNDILIIKTDSNGISGCNETNANCQVTSFPGGGAVAYTHSSDTAVVFSTNVLLSNYSLQSATLCYIGINESNAETNTYSIYPNPATGELRIQNAELKVGSIEIYNTMGRKVFQTSDIDPKMVSIDISKWKAGVYFVKIRDEKNNLVTKKVVKM